MVRSPRSAAPRIRFLFVDSRVRFTLRSAYASRRTPCASLRSLRPGSGRTFTSKSSPMPGPPPGEGEPGEPGAPLVATTTETTRVTFEEATTEIAFTATNVAVDTGIPVPENTKTFHVNYGASTDTATVGRDLLWFPMPIEEWERIDPVDVGDPPAQATTRFTRTWHDPDITAVGGTGARQVWIGKGNNGNIFVWTDNVAWDIYPFRARFEIHEAITVVSGIEGGVSDDPDDSDDSAAAIAALEAVVTALAVVVDAHRQLPADGEDGQFVGRVENNPAWVDAPAGGAVPAPVLVATFTRFSDTELRAPAADRVALLAALRGGRSMIGYEVCSGFDSRGAFPSAGLAPAGHISIIIGFHPGDDASGKYMFFNCDDTPGDEQCSIATNGIFATGDNARMWGI